MVRGETRVFGGADPPLGKVISKGNFQRGEPVPVMRVRYALLCYNDLGSENDIRGLELPIRKCVKREESHDCYSAEDS